jgi:hypothetical protein
MFLVIATGYSVKSPVMTLNAYAAEKRLRIFEDLQQGQPPREGEYSDQTLQEGRVKGKPQMGSTRYEPHAIIVEFIYPDPKSSATVLSVRLPSPERIVFLPVPEWVIESIWQGEIDGSYQFESDARSMLKKFEAELGEEENQPWFGPRQAKRRE